MNDNKAGSVIHILHDGGAFDEKINFIWGDIKINFDHNNTNIWNEEIEAIVSESKVVRFIKQENDVTSNNVQINNCNHKIRIHKKFKMNIVKIIQKSIKIQELKIHLYQ